MKVKLYHFCALEFFSSKRVIGPNQHKAISGICHVNSGDQID